MLQLLEAPAVAAHLPDTRLICQYLEACAIKKLLYIIYSRLNYAMHALLLVYYLRWHAVFQVTVFMQSGHDRLDSADPCGLGICQLVGSISCPGQV